MFGFLGETVGKIFGTDKAAQSLIDNTSAAIDKIFYTEEEKEDEKAKSRTEARLMVIKWMEATSGQNLARRLIALIVTGIWSVQYLAIVGLSVSAVWIENSTKLTKSADVIGNYAVKTNTAFLIILGFYFAAPHMGGMANSALKKFSKAGKAKEL